MNKYRIISSSFQVISGTAGLVGLALGNPEVALIGAGALGASTYFSYVEDERMEQKVEEMNIFSNRSRNILSRFDRHLKN